MSITTRCGVALLAAMLLTAPTVTKAAERATCSAASECNADPADDSVQRAVTPVEILPRPVGQPGQQGTSDDATGKDVPPASPVVEPMRR